MALTGALGNNQAKVYDAENTVSDWRTFQSLDEIQVWVDSLTSSDWWDNRYPGIVRIEVQKSPSRVCSLGTAYIEDNFGIIALTPQAMNARTVLHEIAHCVASTGARHSGAWVREFLAITYHSLNSDCYLELYNAFVGHDVELG